MISNYSPTAFLLQRSSALSSTFQSGSSVKVEGSSKNLTGANRGEQRGSALFHPLSPCKGMKSVANARLENPSNWHPPFPPVQKSSSSSSKSTIQNQKSSIVNLPLFSCVLCLEVLRLSAFQRFSICLRPCQLGLRLCFQVR